MQPPRYVKAASVTNNCAFAVQIVAIYGTDEQLQAGKEKIHVKKTVAVNECVTFTSQSFQMECWEEVAPLEAVEVEELRNAHDHNVKSSGKKRTYTPEATGIIDVLHLSINPHESNRFIVQCKE
uniref:AlNc14C188G8365 protein n=1 Tax=Albugo laibachii Nc14 TaxID=890382 RepID=F0WFN0_9STRA|nr:AlNc14C84G5414 [Albugo laibachii Nc14]CCA23270.1 AlNc14C188G8365 [Albugo laibachii Nc14]|eukprot:CCA23270.1 AlNc14C188G8365 [Albugo laibachii Nc14]